MHLFSELYIRLLSSMFTLTLGILDVWLFIGK